MGLDIHVSTDNFDEISELEAFEVIEEKMMLSREFCNLISRKNVIEKGLPELEQIAQMTNCDITFLYKMENYTSEWEMEDLLEFEDEDVTESIKKSNLEIENNIDVVISNLNALIGKLNDYPMLEEKIAKTDYDTIGIAYYFSDFSQDKGDGYIGNNFGRDLRNLLKFAEFAKKHSSKTIYFQYG